MSDRTLAPANTWAHAHPHLFIESRAGRVVVRCGDCDAALDATRATIAEMAIAVWDHLTHVHGTSIADAQLALAHVSQGARHIDRADARQAEGREEAALDL